MIGENIIIIFAEVNTRELYAAEICRRNCSVAAYRPSENTRGKLGGAKEAGAVLEVMMAKKSGLKARFRIQVNRY